MTGRMLVKVGMIKRVRDLLIAHPLGYPQGDDVASQFVKKVGRVDELLVQKEAGEQTSRTSSLHRRELRRTMLRMTLRHVLTVAKAMAPTSPDVVGGIRRPPPNRSEESFLAAVRAIVDTVESNKAVFFQSGLSESGLAELNQQLATFEEALKEAHAGRRAHTGAQAELRTLVKELMMQVRMLDGIVGLQFRDKPELLGAWVSARNVAWPLIPPKPDSADEQQKPAA